MSEKNNNTSHFYDQLQVLEPAGTGFSGEERLMAIGRPLLAWYGEQARVLPWRELPEPYRVWVSEIMLQQTRVEAVKPYFERFMQELPEVSDLSQVSEERLLKLWEGLGYYTRARNLKRAAQVIVEEYGGELPDSYAELLKLPGIGSYTAGAIASIAYGIPVPAVDGNVLRVLSRVLASDRDILKQSTKRWLEEILLPAIPEGRASHFNQGLIEIGAIVCVPNGQPKCMVCPLASLCLAKIRGLISQIPVKTSKKQRKIAKKTVAVIEYSGKLALNKRENSGLLASLYEFPNVDGQLPPKDLAAVFHIPVDAVQEISPLPSAKHIFSHVEWHMVGYRIILNTEIPSGYLWVSRQELDTIYALPKAFEVYKKEV